MVEIIAKSTHSEKRTRDFFKFHLVKVNPSRYVYFGIAIILLIIALVLALLNNYGGSLFFLFIAIMILIIKVVTTNMLVNRIVKKVVFPSKNYKLIFNENQIIHSTEAIKKTYKWNDFLIIYEVYSYIFFYLTKNQALLLSKYILSEDERTALKEMILNSKVKYKFIKFK